MKDKSFSQKEIIKRVIKQIGKYRVLFAVSILLSVLTVVANLIIPVIFGKVIDLLLGKGQVDFNKIGIYFGIILGIIGLSAICQWLLNIINNKITYNVIKDIRLQVFTHLQKLPFSYIDGRSYGEIVSRNIADVDQFADGLLMGFTQFLTGVLSIFGTLVLMLVLNWIVTLVVVLLTPLSLFVAKFIASRTYSMFKKTSQIRGEQTAFIDEMIGNLKVVKAFTHEDENSVKFHEVNERLSKASLQSIFFSSLTNPTTRFVNSIVYAAVALSGALILLNPSVVLANAFTVGKLSSMLSYANQYAKPFNEISGVIAELQNAIACAGRIYELIDEQEQTPDGNKAFVLENAQGDIQFNHVSFSYQKDRELLKNISLQASKGQKIAIVGPTGCGKTTLINLLMRFYDVDQGSITVDEYDINQLTRHSLRKNYGMVLQDTWLKSGTIRENIIMGKPDATDEEMIAAAQAVHAHHFIMQMGGYDTVIGEDGGNLSQGQKQLLCITRIMLCLPPMLILDEATSSIDTRTELKVQNAFTKMMKGRTSFIVAHRLSTIQEADLILVMKDGNIIEQGNHESLLQLNGFYANLYNSQFTA